MVDFFTPQQQKAIFYAPKLPSLVSILCSLLLIYVLIRDERHEKVYGRLWLGIAGCNLFVALMAGIVSSITSPEGVYYGASGTLATCEASASFFHFVYVAVMVYNGALGGYYYLSVHWNLTERFVATRIEPFFHALAVIWPIVGIVVGNVKKYYYANPIFQVCWAAPRPFGCGLDPTLDCTDGDEHRPLYIFGSGLIATNMGTSVKMIGVSLVVYKIYVQQRLVRSRYETNMASNPRNLLLVETMIQAVSFVMACFIPYAGTIVLRLIDMFWRGPGAGEGAPVGLFVFSIIAHILFPIQG